MRNPWCLRTLVVAALTVGLAVPAIAQDLPGVPIPDGTSGVAAKARSEGRPRPAKTTSGSAIHLALPWGLLGGVWLKAGCTINPWGLCDNSVSTTTPTQAADVGCTLDPRGRCSPGH